MQCIKWSSYLKRLAIGTFLVICSAGVGISYHISNKFLGRSLLPPATQQKIQARHSLLINTYHAQEITFSTKDNERLAGLLIQRPHARRIIIACHGYGRFKEDCWRTLDLFSEDTVLLFDFRAHGSSTGNFTSIGYHEQKDIEAAFDYITTQPHLKNLPVIGIGFSMGAAALLGAAAQGVPFQALIIDSSFDRLDKQIARVFNAKTGLPLFPFFYLAQFFFWYQHNVSMARVNPSAWAKNLTIPLLVIHSLDDAFTPVATSKKIIKNVHPLATHWLEGQASHAELIKYQNEDYKKQVANFLAHYSL